MPSHKSNDYKLTAVKYYLSHSKIKKNYFNSGNKQPYWPST